jgi:hypothetical protein
MTWIVALSQGTNWPSRQISEVRPELPSDMLASERDLSMIIEERKGRKREGGRGVA